MNQLIKFIFIIGSLCSLSNSYAAEPMIIHVAVGKVSEVVLPEKVAKVIKGGAVDTVLVEVIDNSVYILPKSQNPADIFITGISGESYPLNLQIASEQDVRVDVKGGQVARVSAEGGLNPLGVMKEILLEKEPIGATVLKGKGSINMKESHMQLNIDVVYDFPHMVAYVLNAKNITNERLIVPLQQISFPNILAISSDVDSLAPQGQEGDLTKVYIIAGK